MSLHGLREEFRSDSNSIPPSLDWLAPHDLRGTLIKQDWTRLVPQDAILLRVDLEKLATARRNQTLARLHRYTMGAPERRVGGVLDLVVEASAVPSVELIVRAAGGNALHRYRWRHWSPEEAAASTLFALRRGAFCAPLLAVWESEADLKSEGMCPICGTGHTWRGSVKLERRDRIRSWPEWMVTINNCHIVGPSVRGAVLRHDEGGARFFPLQLYPSGRVVADRWAMRGHRTLPACTAQSLIQRERFEPGCAVCKRDTWEGRDISLAYASASVSGLSGCLDTYECSYEGCRPAGGRPGVSALPWLVVDSELRQILEDLPAMKAVKFRPVLLVEGSEPGK